MIKQGKKRVTYIDSAKGIGIFLVIYAHAIGMLNYPTSTETLMHLIIYSFHMPMFFAVSGAGLFYKFLSVEKIDLKYEMLRLLKRLLIPYVFWSVSCVLLRCLSSIIFKENWVETLLNYGYGFFTGMIGTLWFLHTLFIIEAIFLVAWKYLSEKWLAKRTKVVSFMVLIALALTVVFNVIHKFIYSGDINKYLNNPIHSAFRIAPAFFFLCIGYLFADFTERYKSILRKKRITLVLALLLFLSCASVEIITQNDVNTRLFQTGNLFLYFFTAITGTFACLFFSMILPEKVCFIKALGKESMHLMILHYPPFPFLYVPVLLYEKFLPTNLGLISVAVISIVVTVVIYFVSIWIIEPVFNKITVLFIGLFSKN